MRLFIGIDLPQEIKRALLEFQAELRRRGVNGYWKAEDNFHITLEFLGEIDPQDILMLTECMSAAESLPGFELCLEGLGGFPTLSRPHTLWTAVKGQLGELKQLRERIHAELVRNSFRLESREFRPHISLASRPGLKDVELADLQSRNLGDFTVQEITLFESSVWQGKRTYTGLGKIRLL